MLKFTVNSIWYDFYDVVYLYETTTSPTCGERPFRLLPRSAAFFPSFSPKIPFAP